MKHIILFYALLFTASITLAQDNNFVRKTMEHAALQISNQVKNNPDPARIPRSTNKDGSLNRVDIYDWTSGFFAGTLWYLYEYTGDNSWLKEARKRTEVLEDIQFLTDHHDVGFMLYSNYGNGFRLMNYPEYKKVLINGAESLSSRFNPVVGAIKSWNAFKSWDGQNVYHYPVIVDNMMNLELLFWASKETGDNKYMDIALQHARTTMRNHYRDDFSSYHVVSYDSVTGIVLDKGTAQGFTDESSWARGQAWGLYGFIMTYRETGLKELLEMSENIAGYIIDHPEMPVDGIPFWDYYVNEPGYVPEWDYNQGDYKTILRDASAAAITASALLELSTYSAEGVKYRNFAEKILMTLASQEYMAELGENNNFILMHSVGSIPHGFEIDTPIIYTDYYFLEALLRKHKLDNNIMLYAVKKK